MIGINSKLNMYVGLNEFIVRFINYLYLIGSRGD